MLVLFFDNFNDSWGPIVNSWVSDGIDGPKAIMANEVVRVPNNTPFLFGHNIWNLTSDDKIYCFNKSAAEYLERCPCGQKYSVGFNYKDFERVELESIISN